MYKKVETTLDFVSREEELVKFWKENDIMNKSIELRNEGEVFTFYDGPPTANGKPHIGHIITRAVKDLIPRYKTMKGYKVLRKAGWDTHGLPVELEVEKLLNLDGKPDIENYGVEPFIEKCKESVWKYETQWREMSERVGYWADMDNPYVTYDNNYIESVWWSLKQIWDKDLLYKGHKIVPYCPRCGTSLSSHEVAQGYKDVKDLTAYVKFKVKESPNDYLIAWTTTPWTLPSNVALIVNANEDYVLANYISNNENYYVALALAPKLLGEEGVDYTIIKTIKGLELEHMEYVPLFDFATVDKKAWFVGCDDYVTLTDGSGIVHTAPAFGEDDARVGRKYNLPFVQLVDEQGLFKEEATPYAGLFVKKADEQIVKDLKISGKLFKSEKYEHSYPHCWRCDTPLIYYARESWFIEMTKVKENLINNNNKINWIPENIKQGRFGNFLENVVDWGISRERYWGTPLPIWECECGHRHLIGSRDELKSMCDDELTEIELHKPYIDNVHINCPKCTKKMTRVTEVIDCWYDSGSMPFAQWHYPFENKEIFEQNFPANFISEAVDQTRGWFYTLLAISTLVFDQPAYENVVVLGHVQDKNGTKMSKHKGNVVDPWDALNNQGADAVRWYFYANSSPWLPSRYSNDAVNEGQRKFMGTLWNTYAFFVLYANIDDFDATKYKVDYNTLNVLDKWLLSKLNTLVKQVDEGLNEYKITETARLLNDFVDDLSNWYVRRSRERFWGKGMPVDKINAYMTLHETLVTVCKLSAPYVPFITEEIYKNLVCSNDTTAPISIHLCDYPTPNLNKIDLELEKNMDLVLKIVVLGRSGRNESNIKNRQPISEMYIKSEFNLPTSFENIIIEELNVKSIKFIDDISSYVGYSFKPQLKTLGPKYGKIIPQISNYLKSNDGTSLMTELNNGSITFMIDETQVVLTKDDVLIENTQKEGFITQSDRDVSVILNTELSQELLEEGFVREIISKVQTMRKEAGFEVLDNINLYINSDDYVTKLITRNIQTIKDDTLTIEIDYTHLNGYKKDWNINGYEVTMSVEKISK